MVALYLAFSVLRATPQPITHTNHDIWIGTYVLKEDLLLATPPAHPSEIPNANPNPLATTPQPATSGCRPTLVSLDVRHAPRFFLGSSNTTLSLNGAPESIQEHPNESRYSNELGALSSDEGRGTSTSDAPPTTVTLGSSTPAFGEGNALLTPNVNPKDANKKRKPKSNMSKSNSSFISRVIGNDMLSKRLQDRPSDGIFAFANVNRSFQWLDLSSPTKVWTMDDVILLRQLPVGLGTVALQASSCFSIFADRSLFF